MFVVAVDATIFEDGTFCRSDGDVEPGSTLSTRATWLNHAEPATVCTDLFWTHNQELPELTY